MRHLLALIAIGVVTPALSQVTISVDAAANRHPISQEIYGLSFAPGPALPLMNVTLNRSGGNATTRYNWQANASNRAADWYFESISEEGANPGAGVDGFIADTRFGNGEPMITLPILGWAAKLGPGRAKLASYSVAKYGPQQSTDPFMPDAGNGVRPDGTRITNNDPNDANMTVDSAFQLGWIQHLSAEGVKTIILDNEPSLWQETHRDVHPVGATMDEVAAKAIDAAQRVKSVDPAIRVAAPEEWGWGGYFISGYDQQWSAAHNYASFPDRDAHGGWAYLPWLLDQFRRAEVTNGRRLLDIFTVHYYPQGGEYSDNVSTAMQLRRNRSTRALWDPTYVDESWINDKVMLIPRMRQWVSDYYPGTRIGITEYNWGAEEHINGATAQADILGIFGREGIDLATRWTTPLTNTPSFNAIKMYRNYDGQKSGFGDVSVQAAVPNPDQLSAFAAVRSSDGKLTLMIVNKVFSPAPATVTLANFPAVTAAEAWQLRATNRIERIADVPVSGASLSITVPAQSITLLVITRAAAIQPPRRRATRH
jgi:hypothetical protein